MVPAGNAVNETITKLFPYLSKGDIIIDGGNKGGSREFFHAKNAHPAHEFNNRFFFDDGFAGKFGVSGFSKHPGDHPAEGDR